MDGSIFSGNEGLIRTTISFTVSKTGDASNINTTGDNEKFNAESLRVVKKILADKKWTPSTKNGEATDYVFKLPLAMTFQGCKK